MEDSIVIIGLLGLGTLIYFSSNNKNKESTKPNQTTNYNITLGSPDFPETVVENPSSQKIKTFSEI